MTIGTAATAKDTANTYSLREQGADLLQEVIAQLQHFGYTKTAVDTWRHAGDEHTLGHTVRHAYSGGEWIVTHWVDGGGQVEVRWTVRATMPNIQTLMSAILPPAF